ncbi:hypothetical protein NM208_g5206 [Fusarium decemcellulare]|uniref:Uncharacterized protein n=1 Tax=Fusarium decemcellulare TaxID=57161 RepID=A0ACC1SHV1_9HYPO|nr:hypothetical protein NM208_g5206 [Fusarium decemcellulare]
MSTAVAERLVGMSLKALGKGAGEEAVKEICSLFMGDIFGGGDGGNAEANAEILAKLDKILSGLDEVKDSLRRIEQAVAQVDADIDAAAIQHEVSTITWLHDSYFDNLKGLSMSRKGSDPASKQDSARFRARLVEISITVKNKIPESLRIIHDFVAGQGNYLGRLAKANVSQAKDIFDFYGQTKLPLIKIAIIENKAIHLLRFAAADPDSNVNFPDGPAAIERASRNIDIQEESLRSSIGPKSHDLVSTILTEYPKPVPACINVYETRGLTYDADGPTWYGGHAIQLWHLEPANDGPIVTDGSKANGFRLKNMNSDKYISIHEEKSIMSLIFYDLPGIDSPTDAAVWTFHLTPDWKFLLRSQAYPNTFFKASIKSGDDNQPRHNVTLTKYGDPTKDTQSFTVNIYRGPINDFWPGNITTMNNRDRLYPGVYLESPNKNYRLTFEGEKFGVWDVDKKLWKWDSGASIDTFSAPYVEFSGSGYLSMCQESKVLKFWGFSFNTGPYSGFMLSVTDEGIVQIGPQTFIEESTSEAQTKQEQIAQNKPDARHIYTNSSGINGSIGAAAVCTTIQAIKSTHMGDDMTSTVYAGELQGISLTLQMAQEDISKGNRRSRVLIYTDNQAAIPSTAKPKGKSGAYLLRSITQ